MELVNPNVNIWAILPETIVAVTGIIVMLYDCFAPRQRNVTAIMSLIGLAVAAGLMGRMWVADAGIPVYSWNGMIAHDSLRLSFSFVFLIVTALTILASVVWVEREDVP